MNYNKLLDTAKVFWSVAPPILGFYRGFNYHDTEPLYTINTLFGLFGVALYATPGIKETIFVLHEIPKFEAECRGFKYRGLFKVDIEDKTTKS